MSILDSLARDHRAIERLLTELGETASREGNQRVAVFSRLQALVQAHSRAEEEVVYRRLRRRLPEEEKVLEAFEEHHVGDLLLLELASAVPGGPGWAAKLKVLEELQRLHIKEEELDLFALVREHLDDAEQARMEREFRALKHEGLEALLGPLRRATPAFAGRATVGAQAAAGRFVRRGELYMRRALGQLRA